MTDSAAAELPQGLFDRTSKGFRVGPVPVRVERGRIRFLAQVLGLADPIHADVEIARAQGFPDLVAPPSFFTVIEAEANEELRRTGRASVPDRIRCDYRYLLHGEERYDYSGRVFAGEDVTLTTTVLDFYDKKGGSMEFVTLESFVEHRDRGVLVRAVRTLLHRLG